jgi:hypothetical protein
VSKFRVSRFLKRDLVARVSFLNDKGIIQNSRKFFEFYPSDNQESEGWYDTTDEVLLASLKEQTEQLPYSPETEEGLKQDGVEYEYAYCASCGGKKVRKLKYNLFEVIE